MPDPRHIETRPVALAEIEVRDRLRPVSEAGVASIVASIRLTGVMKDEIILRKMKGRKAQPFRLIAGGHRLAAAREMDWADIPAKVFTCDDHWAQLMEVDDNLAHAELSPLELATFLAKRKHLYLLAHPETAQGKAGATARWEDATDIMSFASMIAEKRDCSEKTVRRYAAIGEALDADVAAQLAPINPGFAVLNDIVKLEAPEQRRVALRLADGSASKVADALRLVRKEPKPIQLSPDDAAYEKLMAGWGRASTAAKRRFLSQLWAEAPDLMADEASRSEAKAS